MDTYKVRLARRIVTVIGPSVLTLIALMFVGCGGGASNPSSAVTSNPSAADVTAPTITTHPASQEVTAGSTATFSVANTGSHRFSINGARMELRLAGRHPRATPRRQRPLVTMARQIDVVVSNSAGRATSNPATLTVKAGKLALDASTTSLSLRHRCGNVSSSTMRSVITQQHRHGNRDDFIRRKPPVRASPLSGVAPGTFLSPGQSATLDATFAPCGQRKRAW